MENRIKFFAVATFVFLFSIFVVQNINAADVKNFNVDKDFDALGRIKVEATLIETTNRLYFYVEKTWWSGQPSTKKAQILTNLNELAKEFENRIYPTLVSVFGSEWNPGIDKDGRITILFENINNYEGGYFRTADEYEKLQIPNSNEREMLYLSLDQIENPRLKIFLAHEFVHLITFNQKNKNFGVEEETWLNEARAEYVSTLLGYDNVYEDSNLQSRVKDFVANPSDSVTDWGSTKYDYASASLFTHYITDHYGRNILSDSLRSKYIGIESINYALKNNGFKEDFGQVFTDWTIALLLNDCSANKKYCYINPNLKNLRLVPSLNFLPLTGNVSLSVANATKNWAGNWFKFIGGNGNLKLSFSSFKGLDFKVPYIVEDSVGALAVKFLFLDKDARGEIDIKNFGTDYNFLIIIPSLQTKVSGFDFQDSSYPFTYAIKITDSNQSNEQDLINQLLEKIAYLKSEIARLQGQATGQCRQLTDNLYEGMTDNSQVICLQQFLKLQGSNIYPEGLITGYFGSLTKAAVIRFQEKYFSEILAPISVSSGTGFVGNLTRNKINQLLGSGSTF
jgi:hypothetical protein